MDFLTIPLNSSDNTLLKAEYEQYVRRGRKA